MTSFLLSVVTTVLLCTFAAAKSLHTRSYDYPFPFVSREQWGAEAASSVTSLAKPAQYVIIHHSYEPSVCLSRKQCVGAMRSMQKYHQMDQGWNDIGYNFAVGGEGAAYEGRGWGNVGAHAVGFNDRSVGICIIGDWRNELPPGPSLETAKQLISVGVELGYISPDYTLLGHQQASATECPGQALFDEISTWKGFRKDLPSM